MLRRSFIALALTLTLAPGCADVEFTSQEVRFVHDVEEDALDLLILSHGLMSRVSLEEQRVPFQMQPKTSAEALEMALELTRAWARGDRRFTLFCVPLDFDIEQISGAESSADEELAGRGDALLEQVEVLEAGAFLDADDRLATFQRLRLGGADAWIEFVNDAWTRSMQAELAKVPAEERELAIAKFLEVEEFDRRSAELWMARLRADRPAPWIALDNGAIRFDFPVTAETATGVLRSLFDGAAQVEERTGSSLWAQVVASIGRSLRRLEIGPERTIVEFAPDPGGTFVLRSGNLLRPYDPALRDAFVAAGEPLVEGVEIEGLRAALTD